MPRGQSKRLRERREKRRSVEQRTRANSRELPARRANSRDVKFVAGRRRNFVGAAPEQPMQVGTADAQVPGGEGLVSVTLHDGSRREFDLIVPHLIFERT